MGAAQMKKIRYIAAGYATYSLMYVVMAGALVSAGGWRGPEQLIRDFDVIGGTLLFILGLFF